MHLQWEYRRYLQIAVAFLVGAVAMFGAVPRSYADTQAQCQKRIQKAENDVEQQIRKHGERSREAENARANLNNQRERCWNEHHQWWSGKDQQWHKQRDWDQSYRGSERDRDHDRDHHRDHEHDHDRDRDQH